MTVILQPASSMLMAERNVPGERARHHGVWLHNGVTITAISRVQTDVINSYSSAHFSSSQLFKLIETSKRTTSKIQNLCRQVQKDGKERQKRNVLNEKKMEFMSKLFILIYTDEHLFVDKYWNMETNR